jgi:hypothetical protein
MNKEKPFLRVNILSQRVNNQCPTVTHSAEFHVPTKKEREREITWMMDVTQTILVQSLV